MNGAAPLLRLVDAAARQSCSRIPHLTAHIRSRHVHHGTSSLKRQCRPQAAAGLLTSHARRASSLVDADASLFSYTRDTYEEESPSPRGTYELTRASEAGDSTHDAGTNTVAGDAAGISVESIVEEGHPDRVLCALVSTREGQDFIRTASNAVFEKAILCLDPEHFVGRYFPMYRHMTPTLHVTSRFRVVRSLEDRCDVFRSCLLVTCQKRREAVSGGITLPVYRHLLRCAAMMGDEHLARSIFDSQMPFDGIQPDLACYNGIMTACARSYEFDALARVHHRQTPYHRRRLTYPDPGELYTRIGDRHPFRSRNSALREDVLKLFKDMSEKGIPGDEETFTAIMRALALSHDINGVESILRSVWNIDVQALMKHDEEEIESPTFYEEDSPLRPSQRLLETVVHVFASDNQLTTATLLCDYISRHYNLPISQRVWDQQFQFMYQFTYRPVTYHARRRQIEGNLPREALRRIYSVMTDEPHNVQPSVTNLALLVRHDVRWLLADWQSKLSSLREAVRLLDQQKSRLSELYDAFLLRASRFQEEAPLSTEFLDKRQAYVELAVQTEADLQHILITVRRLLTKRIKSDNVTATDFYVRGIPDIIREFNTMLPNKLFYYTFTGKVCIENGYIHREHAIGLADDNFMRKAALLRQALDLDDHLIIIDRMAKLPGILRQRFDETCHMCGDSGHIGQECPEAPEILAGHLKVRSHDPTREITHSTNTRGKKEVLIWDDKPLLRDSPQKGAKVEPLIDLDHDVAPPQRKHFVDLSMRIDEARSSPPRGGQTPDPALRFPPADDSYREILESSPAARLDLWASSGLRNTDDEDR